MNVGQIFCNIQNYGLCLLRILGPDFWTFKVRYKGVPTGGRPHVFMFLILLQPFMSVRLWEGQRSNVLVTASGYWIWQPGNRPTSCLLKCANIMGG